MKLFPLLYGVLRAHGACNHFDDGQHRFLAFWWPKERLMILASIKTNLWYL